MNNNNLFLLQNNYDNKSLISIEQNIESLEIAVIEGDLGNSEFDFDHLQNIADKLYETFPTLTKEGGEDLSIQILDKYDEVVKSLPANIQYKNMNINQLLDVIEIIGAEQTSDGFLENLHDYMIGFMNPQGRYAQSNQEGGEDEMSQEFPSFVNESSSEQSLMNFDNIQQQAPNNNLQQQPAQSDDPVSSRTRLKTGAGIQKIYKGM
jgi:hypothetical protein